MPLLPLLAVLFAPIQPSGEALGHPGGSWLARNPDKGLLGYGIVGRIGTSRLRHGGDVRSLAFSPNSGLVVSADCQRTVIVWEVQTGKAVRQWDLPARVCGPVGFSADGCRIIWSLGDGCLRTYDIRSGAEVQAIRHYSPKAVHAFRSDGEIVGVDRDGRLRVWDETTGQAGDVEQPDDRAVRSECGRYEAAVTAPSVLTCLDRASGTEQTFSPGEDRLHRLGCLSFSADSRFLFASAFGGRVLRFERSSGRVVNRYGPLAISPDCLAIARDGSRLAIAAGNRIHLFDAATGGELFPTADAFARPPALRLSDDGRTLLLTGGYPMPREEAWDLTTFRRRSSRSIPRSAWDDRMSVSPIISPGGKVRVSLGGKGRGFSQFDTSVLSFSDHDGRPLWSVKKGLPGREGYAFSPDGAWAAVIEECGVAVYDSATGRTIRDMPYTGALALREWAHGIAFTPDRFAVVTAHPSGIAYWPIATSSTPREVRLPTGETLDGREGLLTVSPDGRLAVVGNDRFELVAYELATLGERFRLSTRPHGPAASVLFTPDGRHLIVANGDCTVTVHDVAAGSEAVNGPPPVLAAAWSALGSDDAAAAFRAMRQLVSAKDYSVDWMRSQLRSEPDDRIPGWIRQLDASRYAVRESAQRALTRLGHSARPGLVAASRTDMSPECGRRVEALLEGTRGPDLSTDGIRTGRAIEIAERIGTGESRKLLQEWAAGPDGATLTESARAALARLDRDR